MKTYILLLALIITSSPLTSISAEKSDANGDGFITKQEWMDAGTKRLERQFELQDKNKNGYLEPEEQRLIRLGNRMKNTISGGLDSNGNISIDKMKQRAIDYAKRLKGGSQEFQKNMQKKINELSAKTEKDRKGGSNFTYP